MSLHVEALSIGYAVPRTGFEARVHSLFPSAANLKPAGGTRLLTLVAAGEADLPQGMRLDTPKGFSFESLQPGEGAECREGLLRFEHSSLTVGLRQARRWKCDLPALTADLTAPAVAAAWRTVWQALNARQARTGAEIIAKALIHPPKTGRSPAAQKIGELIRELVRATLQNDPSAIIPTAAGLVGLGGGLTPGGDDLLVGFLAGLWCAAGGRKECLEFLASLGRAVVRLSRRTNDISRTYLYHAAHGQVASRLADLAGAICRGESPDRLIAAAEAAMRVGHDSGMETVTGLLLGLSAWEQGFRR
jgi:hypothetical protein